MKTKFLSISMGVAMILLAAGFFIRSFNTVNAAPKPEKFIMDGTSSNGKYSMCMLTSSSGMVATILNTQTGVSETYYYDGAWAKLPKQIPAVNF